MPAQAQDALCLQDDAPATVAKLHSAMMTTAAALSEKLALAEAADVEWAAFVAAANAWAAADLALTMAMLAPSAAKEAQ